jgi:diketogulonate reductase-like aldo/keto reductase
MKITDYYTLSNGVKIPIVGFGTWQIENKDIMSCINIAIDCGYRHIDTASIYGNEEEIGAAIKKIGIEREKLFITGKLWNTDHSYNKVLIAIDKSLKLLKIDYLDLYLIHWPNPKEIRDNFESTIIDTWNGMENIYKNGKVRAIGVSNFLPHHLSVIINNSSIHPTINQIRLFPGSQQFDTIKFCREKNILLEGYSPLGSGKIFESKELLLLSKKYNKTIAQICVRWSLQMGFLPIPKSKTPSRIMENIDIFDFELDNEDVKKLKGIKNYCLPNPNPDRVHF